MLSERERELVMRETGGSSTTQHTQQQCVAANSAQHAAQHVERSAHPAAADQRATTGPREAPAAALDLRCVVEKGRGRVHDRVGGWREGGDEEGAEHAVACSIESVAEHQQQEDSMLLDSPRCCHPFETAHLSVNADDIERLGCSC